MTSSLRRAQQLSGCATFDVEASTDADDLARALLWEAAADDAPGGDRATQTSIEAGTWVTDATWRALAAAAENHGVTPLLAPAIMARDARSAPSAPADVRRSFTVLAARHRRAALVRERCIDRLLSGFYRAGVEVILLKGAALAHLLYGDPGLRAMLDVDVLIDPRDGTRAATVSQELGFTFQRPPRSAFASRRHHHLPVATTAESGFGIALEIHTDTLALEHPERMPFASVAARTQSFPRGSGPAGRALGHVDMLRHLARHAFVPARRIRLIHLHDLWRYPAAFGDEIDWHELRVRFPHVLVALELAEQVFTPSHARAAKDVGRGMIPLSEIAAGERGARRKLAALLNPPSWWMHGFYGVPPQRSLLVCRTVQHPATLARWMATRVASRLRAPAWELGR